MKYLDKTIFYKPYKPYNTITITEDTLTREDAHYTGVYLRQKTIRCAICKKPDKMATTDLEEEIGRKFGMPDTVVYILFSEIHIDGNVWTFVPASHSGCTEIAKMGLLL